MDAKAVTEFAEKIATQVAVVSHVTAPEVVAAIRVGAALDKMGQAPTGDDLAADEVWSLADDLFPENRLLAEAVVLGRSLSSQNTVPEGLGLFLDVEALERASMYFPDRPVAAMLPQDQVVFYLASLM